MNGGGKIMNDKMVKLLYRSLDNPLGEKKQRTLSEALQNSKELRKEKERILAQRRSITEAAPSSFGPYFAEKVMEKIESLHTKKKNGLELFYETFKTMFQRVAIVSALILLLLVSYNLIKKDLLPKEEIMFASDAVVEEILEVPLF